MRGCGGEQTHIGSAHEAAFLRGELAVAHQSSDAGKEGSGAKVCARLQHWEDKRELPHLAKNMSGLQGNAIGVSRLVCSREPATAGRK
eukprot:6209887-Pleurochrysis_carterae.AAC.1